MRYLRTLDELLAMRSNAWSCGDCGKAWADSPIPGLWFPITDAGADCRHRQLVRGLVHGG